MSELQQIMDHVHAQHYFLLSGGAGSGKTYTLVEVLRQIIQENPTKRVACITYTNAAVKEIERRVANVNLRVSTIHDFLWDNISHFQPALKDALIKLINDGVITRSVNIELPMANDFYESVEGFNGVQYKEYCRVSEGIISHDEILVLAEYMYRTYPKLGEILKGTYPFVLVDEYQDTSPLVVKILLEDINPNSGHKFVVGFFGDVMQSIYNSGVGNIDTYKAPNGNVYEVKKEQNRRNPRQVIDLANKIRIDGLTQRPSEDKYAPNMKDGIVKDGVVKFIYSSHEGVTVEQVRSLLESKYGRNFRDAQRTKELNLTHNLIAGKAGFAGLMEIHNSDGVLSYRDKVRGHIKDHPMDTNGKTFGEVVDELERVGSVSSTRSQQLFIKNHHEDYQFARNLQYDGFIKEYVDKDQLVDDKKQEEDEESKTGSRRSELIKHLMDVERCVQLYRLNDISEFIAKTEYRINTVKDKKELAEIMQNLSEPGEKTIGEILKYAEEKGIVKKSDGLIRYEERNKYVVNRVRKVKYKELHNLFEYLEGKTPFSTQHKTKGSEFDDVFVILDNGGWNNYSFERLFAGADAKHEQQINRTKKIFYVCCTRAKEKLAVYYDRPIPAVIAKASEWFGRENLEEI